LLETQNGGGGEEWLPGGRPVDAPVTAPPSPDQAWPASDPDPEVERLWVELLRAERRAEAAERRAEAAEHRARKTEEQLRRRDGSAEAARRPAEQTAARLAVARATARVEVEEPPSAGDVDGPLDLNRATFEALRALGLSITQSARVIGQRDARGGFRSLDDIRTLWGLPGEAKETLRRHGSI